MNPVDDFLAEKEKQAGWLTSIGNAFKEGLGGGHTMGQAMAKGLGAAAPGVLLAGAVGAAGMGIQSAYGAVKDRFSKSRDYKNMLEANPMLRKRPAGEVQLMYNSLRKMAPAMAKEPLVAGSYVRQMLDASPESGPAVPPATAKLLAETQRNLAQSSMKTPLFNVNPGTFKP